MVSGLVDATMPIIVSLIGVIITVFTLIMIIRNLEAALFWMPSRSTRNGSKSCFSNGLLPRRR